MPTRSQQQGGDEAGAVAVAVGCDERVTAEHAKGQHRLVLPRRGAAVNFHAEAVGASPDSAGISFSHLAIEE